MGKSYDKDLTKSIGEKIRVLRKSKKLSQQELAERTGITRATISNYEIGRRTPHLRDLQVFCWFFGVGIEYFGIALKDDVFDVLARAKEVFESSAVPRETKEDLHREFMKLYIKLSEGEKE